jgi:hypothetical protein
MNTNKVAPLSSDTLRWTSLPIALLEARYPFVRQLAAGPLKMRRAFARAAVYRLQPNRIVPIGNKKSFGHK